MTLPALGESVNEGTVSRWLKQVGDRVEADEPLLEVSTDKVDTEIPSPASGTLLEIRVQEDESVEVGAVLAVVGEASNAGRGGRGRAASGRAGARGPAGAGTDGAAPDVEAAEPETATVSDGTEISAAARRRRRGRPGADPGPGQRGRGRHRPPKEDPQPEQHGPNGAAPAADAGGRRRAKPAT